MSIHGSSVGKLANVFDERQKIIESMLQCLSGVQAITSDREVQFMNRVIPSYAILPEASKEFRDMPTVSRRSSQ